MQIIADLTSMKVLKNHFFQYLLNNVLIIKYTLLRSKVLKMCFFLKIFINN